MKPHIKVYGRTSYGVRVWRCCGYGGAGYGVSPKVSYDEWLKIRRLMSRAIMSINNASRVMNPGVYNER
jgi:hypothetical protein